MKCYLARLSRSFGSVLAIENRLEEPLVYNYKGDNIANKTMFAYDHDDFYLR